VRVGTEDNKSQGYVIRFRLWGQSGGHTKGSHMAGEDIGCPIRKCTVNRTVRQPSLEAKSTGDGVFAKIGIPPPPCVADDEAIKLAGPSPLQTPSGLESKIAPATIGFWAGEQDCPSSERVWT
jgi:hypothetical protein